MSFKKYGCYVELCAQIMFKAILKYAKSREGDKCKFLRVITYIDIDSDTIKVFQREFERLFKKVY